MAFYFRLRTIDVFLRFKFVMQSPKNLPPLEKLKKSSCKHEKESV